MFRRNERNHEGTYAAPPPRQGFFSRFRSPHPADQPQYNLASTTHTYGPQSGYGVRQYYRDPYYEGSTRSDWDHYAVRHEEALIGDPVPIMRNNLNLAANQTHDGSTLGPYGPGPLARGPVNHGYDDAHYDRRHPAFHNVDKRGAPLVGPVTANGPLPGNYASGVVVEKNFVKGPGAARSRTGMLDDPAYQRGWQSAAWGAAPLYDDDIGYGPNGHQANSLYANGAHGTGLYPETGPVGSTAWGSAPLYGYRDSRMAGRATPLLPDNPWTHNELGRDWEDGYRRGTIPYSSINNAFVQPARTENFVEYGPNGERIEGYRTRVIREDIVPPVTALGQVTTTNTTKSTKDVVAPVLPVAAPVYMPTHPIPADAVAIPIGHHTESVKVAPTTTTTATTVVRAL